MPAKSIKQQKFMALVDLYKRKKIKNVSKAVKDAAKSMTKKEVKDFARTKHKGLPQKVKKDAAIIFSEIKKLTYLANDLDNKGLYKEADQIDSFIFKIADRGRPPRTPEEISAAINGLPTTSSASWKWSDRTFYIYGRYLYEDVWGPDSTPTYDLGAGGIGRIWPSEGISTLEDIRSILHAGKTATSADDRASYFMMLLDLKNAKKDTQARDPDAPISIREWTVPRGTINVAPYDGLYKYLKEKGQDYGYYEFYVVNSKLYSDNTYYSGGVEVDLNPQNKPGILKALEILGPNHPEAERFKAIVNGTQGAPAPAAAPAAPAAAQPAPAAPVAPQPQPQPAAVQPRPAAVQPRPAAGVQPPQPQPARQPAPQARPAPQGRLNRLQTRQQAAQQAGKTRRSQRIGERMSRIQQRQTGAAARTRRGPFRRR